MKLRLRRSGKAGASGTETEIDGEQFVHLAVGTSLGSFIEAGLRVEVFLSGEQRLWLRCRPSRADGDFEAVDIGSIRWSDCRTPCLDPVPDWLEANSWTSTVLVLKSAVLHRAVVRGEALDPTLGIEINAALGDLVYQAEAVHQGR
ncbi:hypothetical protein [Glycomyces sp. NPDC021274]|uniref:hypothetical protein n=1 Tax=Glycomyces sp. NPDC021274 TaxID=3155120 RepID=UPI0033F54FF7